MNIIWNINLKSVQFIAFIFQGMSEKMSKQVQGQIDELNCRLEESARTISDLQGQKARSQNENSDLTRQLEDAESRISQLNKERQNLLSQLEEAKRSLEEETRVL